MIEQNVSHVCLFICIPDMHIFYFPMDLHLGLIENDSDLVHGLLEVEGAPKTLCNPQI